MQRMRWEGLLGGEQKMIKVKGKKVLFELPKQYELALSNKTKRILNFKYNIAIDKLGKEIIFIEVTENKRWWEIWK